jgi:hypothetical protein
MPTRMLPTLKLQTVKLQTVKLQTVKLQTFVMSAPLWAVVFSKNCQVLAPPDSPPQALGDSQRPD